MTYDRRITPFSGRVAHIAWQNRIEAAHYSAGEAMQVAVPICDLCAAPDGARDRQLLYGDRLCALDEKSGYSFVLSYKDGYCGWVKTSLIQRDTGVQTHWVFARSTHVYSAPKVQAPEIMPLPFAARICVLERSNGFAHTPLGYVPLQHLRLIDQPEQDPIEVAQRFEGAPYLWGGNSAAGIDCSGLVQAALLACDIPCPADSDLQQHLGAPLAKDASLVRGDLVFWKGHVAIVVDNAQLIHANGHHMCVTQELIAHCIARIAAAGGGPVTALRRLNASV